MMAKNLIRIFKSFFGAAFTFGVFLLLVSNISAASERAIMVRPLTKAEYARADFDPAESAGLFVGVRQFFDEDGRPSTRISEVPYAADDAIDLAYLFASDLKLIAANKLTLALSGDPIKEKSKRRLKTLLDAGARRTNARFTNLLRHITKAKNNAGEKGLLVIHFSTHGYTQNGDRLLGQDSSLSDLDLTGLPVSRIMDDVATSKAPRRIVLLDACRELMSPGRSLGDPAASMSPGFAKAIGTAKGMVVFSSTTVGGFSYDDPNLRNGVFTAKVIEGLQGAAQPDERGFITPATLARFLDEQVRRWVALNRPEHKDRSSGISFNVDDQRSARMPLAVNPKVSERRQRLLGVLRKNMDFKIITAPMVQEIVEGLEKADPDKIEGLYSRLERLEREGPGYREDFTFWWKERGLKEILSVASTRTYEAATPKLLRQAISFYSGAAGRVEEEKARTLFLKAGETEDPLARMWLARLWHMGRFGFELDAGRAEDLARGVIQKVKQRADQGDAEAQFLLASAYHDGLAVSKSSELAAEWYQKAANKGNTLAMTNLGVMYAEGRGVAKDDARAVHWYQKAADKGNIYAMDNLGLMYKYGRGVAKDDAQAVRWYQKAADKGNALAMTNLGGMYQNGLGVVKDDARAVRWYQKAADKGNTYAMTNLGWMYQYGSGVAKDDAQAVRWYQKAANKGYAEAMTNLGWMYANGRGVVKNDTQAVRWYQKAADKGNARAMNNLGFQYRYGRGVAQDLSQARYWYSKAAEKGYELAKENLRKLKSTYKPRGAPPAMCFIATAAFGSYMEPHVLTLRAFRDRYLIPNALGCMFINSYYKYSPPIADFIAKHETLKMVVRISLLPLVAISYSAIHFGPTVTATGLMLIFVVTIFLISLYRRRVRVIS